LLVDNNVENERKNVGSI